MAEEELKKMEGDEYKIGAIQFSNLLLSSPYIHEPFEFNKYYFKICDILDMKQE